MWKLTQNVSESNPKKAKAIDVETENTLVTTKPWFSKSEALKQQGKSRKNDHESESCMSIVTRPHKASSILPSSYIYDTTGNVNAKTTLGYSTY